MAAGEAGLPVDPFLVLSKAWYNLRLSVRCPSRVPTWDAVLLTSSSPQQSQLYQSHLDLAKRRGTIAPSTIALAIPDPCGFRIGSGGATLHAIRSLSQFLQENGGQNPINEIKFISDMKILLVHAGGDSKRVPWANPIGKAFLPLPFLAEDNPDNQAPSLFDHILAISSFTAQRFKGHGGLFIMTGDVLPCYDFSDFLPPENGACILTVPAATDITANHGVVLTSLKGEVNLEDGQKSNLERVTALLQKPTYNDLLESGAIRSDGKALLDTGIFAVQGKAWKDLIEFANEEADPVSALLQHNEEISLYEEIAGAWVPACHEWIRTRPLGVKIIEALSSEFLYSFCAQDLSFLHFGTSVEVLDHLSKDHRGRIGYRHMILATNNAYNQLAPSAVVLSTEIRDTVSVGEKSLVYMCSFVDSVYIGSHCVVLGIHLKRLGVSNHPIRLLVPDNHCLWDVPVVGCGDRVTFCCSIHDNPKLAPGTFCGKSWKRIFHELQIEENDVWSDNIINDSRNLWNAKLFPVVAPNEGIVFAMWLMRVNPGRDSILHDWKMCKRISLSEAHDQIDFGRLSSDLSAHQSSIALGLAKESILSRLLCHDMAKLCSQIIEGHGNGVQLCRDLLQQFPSTGLDTWKLPLSRVYQAQLDISKACNYNAAAMAYEKHSWDAVAAETAIAVGRKEVENVLYGQPSDIFSVNSAKLELPVRIDFAGGWSDTPPWSLERIGRVFNMSICLNGVAPIGTELIVTSEAGITLTDDAGYHLIIEDPSTLNSRLEADDPFRLVKSALIATGLAYSTALKHNGLSIKTWANVPRGSGLGTSSILGAAVVKCVLQIMGKDDSDENVSKLVLLVEQLMGTGGGWQDQIGGLYPGIKCTTSFPTKPLMLKVERTPITDNIQKELEERLVIFFTGQVRLAYDVLHNVVRRYLQRDSILISTIEQLVILATRAEEAMKLGNLDTLGTIISDVWRLHQELDPFCSNEFVDGIFNKVHKWACGYKLVGAGGGGFGILLAKDSQAAQRVKQVLSGASVEVYNWNLFK